MPASFTPDPNAGQQSSGGMPSSFTPDSFGQAKAALGHSNSLFMGTSGLAPTSAFTVQGIQQAKQQIGSALPTAGAIAGGIGGAALGGLAGIETGPGALATGYAGGVVGAGAGAALGETANEAMNGQPLDPTAIAEQGGGFAAAEAIGGPVLGAAKDIIAPSAEKTAQATLEAISPKLTAKETADAIANRGGTKTGLLGKIKANIDPTLKKVADAVSKYVPDFNPKATYTENVNATRNAVYKMADDLKTQVANSGKDIIYPFKELASKMNAVEKPIAIKSDTTLNNQFTLAKNAALKIAKESGGKISDLLDARKSFDSLVQKQFPNLYDKANAPMRSAITSMRNVMNDFIADKLPDVAYKDSLSAQSNLFTAIDNMSEKAAGEVNTNVLQRATTAVKNHPLVSGLGAAALYGEAKKIPVIGGLLP